jgi:probable F420-dependent oxidoreductase
MKVEITLPSGDWSEIAQCAADAEAIGADSISTSELAHESFLRLALATQSTSKVDLATSIAIAFARSPMVLAQMSWDLHANTGGRFYLGLGTQVKGHNVRRFSVPWTAPAPRLQEYVEALRAIWRCWESGEKLNYTGEHYNFTLMTPEFSPPATGLPMPAVSLAAVGPAMLRVAGRVGDGVRLHSFCTQRYMEEVCMGHIETGLAQSGRTRADIEVHGGGFVAMGEDDEAVEKMVDAVRYRVGFYGSTRTYFPVWELYGLEDLGLKLHQLVADGKWDQIAGEVSDDVVRLFAAVGTYENIASAIGERFKGADSLKLSFPEGTATGLKRDLVQDLQRIETPFQGHKTQRWAA